MLQPEEELREKTTRRENGNKNLKLLEEKKVHFSESLINQLSAAVERLLCLVLFKERDYKIVGASLVPTKTVDGANLKITTPFLGGTEITWNAWLLKKVVNIMCYFFYIFFLASWPTFLFAFG